MVECEVPGGNSPKRPFFPGFVAAFGAHFVAVDGIQPVAVVLSHDGRVVDVLSWAGRVRAPIRAAWPNRRFGGTPETVFVQDLPDGSVIALSMDHAGRVEIDVVDEFPAVDRLYYRRFFANRPELDRWLHGDAVEWLVNTNVRGIRLHTTVSRRFVGHRVDVKSPAPASAMSCSVGGDSLAVCVQREDKRPFPLRPRAEIQLFTGIGERVSRQVVPSVDITDSVWPKDFSRARTRGRITEFADYRMFLEFERRSVLRWGADHAEVAESGDAADGSVVTELRFTVPSSPGREFVRLDRPFDELGNLCGLREMNVSLVEDLDAGLTRQLADSPVVWL